MDRRQLLVDSFKIEDDLGVVIRSQIIIEQYLNEIIESVLLRPEKYRKINLDYHVKVQFVVALGLDERFESILNVLGTLRNDFAHNLRSEISKQDANNIYQSLDEERKNTVQVLYKNIKSRLSDSNLPKYTNLLPKDKYILYVIALCGALEVACELLPNKKIN